MNRIQIYHANGDLIPSKVIANQVQLLLDWNDSHIKKAKYIPQIRENIKLINYMYYPEK